MPMIIENEDYTNAMNVNFCGGVCYCCDELEAFMKEKKRTIGQIETWLKDKRNESMKIRKALTVNKNIKKATFLK